MSYEDNGALRGPQLVDQVLAEGQPEEQELWGFVRQVRAGGLSQDDAAQALQYAFVLGMQMVERQRAPANPRRAAVTSGRRREPDQGPQDQISDEQYAAFQARSD